MNWMNQIATLWMQWQIAMFWQASVLIVAVWTADRLCRKRVWPQLRYVLWMLVLVKLMVPPTWGSPVSLMSRFPQRLPQQQQTARMAVLAGPPERPSQYKNVEQDLVAHDRSQPAPVATLSVATGAATSLPRSTWTWPMTLFSLWIIGIGALSVVLIMRLRRVYRMLRVRHTQPTPCWLEELVMDVAADVHLKRIPRLVLTDGVECPAVFGLIRPILLMPAHQLKHWSRTELRHSLYHELAHIKRGDLWSHACYIVLTLLYWFHPLMWLIRRPLQHLRELCCDATVACYLREDTLAYRETLRTKARDMLSWSVDSGLGLLGLMEDTHLLAVRLQCLKHASWRYGKTRKLVMGAVVLLMCCCVLPMSPVVVARETLRVPIPETSGNLFRIELPNGVGIELIGVRNMSVPADSWWKPDGTRLEESPYDTPVPGLDPAEDRVDYEIAVRYTGLNGDQRGHIRSDPGSSWGGTIPWRHELFKQGKPVNDIAYLQLTPKCDLKTVDVSVYVATGEWETHTMNYSGPGGSWHAMATQNTIYTRPYDQEGQMHMTVTHDLQDCDTRAVALDVNNVSHLSLGGGGLGALGVKQSTHVFDLVSDEVIKVELQKRRYDRVTFNNVSLVAQQQTSVETDIEAAASPPVSVLSRSELDGQALRDFTHEALQAFHRAILSFLTDNDRTLPKNITALKVMQKPDHYLGVGSFVEGVVYLPGPTFRSLKPEYFLSDRAKEIPICYIRKMQKIGNEIGTSVLFGDGHIEWHTQDRLQTLSADRGR